MNGHDELRQLLGGYVLGGLDAHDRQRLEEHLAGCEACREELASYAPLPGLLRQAGPVPDRDDRPSPDLLPRLLSEVQRRRTVRRRAAVLAAAAAVVVALAGAWLARPTEEPAPERQATTVALSAVGEGAAEGSAELVEKGWGTELVLEASSLPAAGPFALEVVAADGTTQRAATWGPTAAGRALVTGATSVPRADIRSVTVVGPEGPLLGADLTG
jgi:hypothetical protein